MTVEELITHVNQKEVQMNTRKEQIFNSILSTLGTSDSIDVETKRHLVTEMSEIKAKFIESQQAREQHKVRNEMFLTEQQEKRDLETQRQKLKSRFDVDSVDNQGVNPLEDSHFGGSLNQPAMYELSSDLI
jgi:hypothetical protein